MHNTIKTPHDFPVGNHSIEGHLCRVQPGRISYSDSSIGKKVARKLSRTFGAATLTWENARYRGSVTYRRGAKTAETFEEI